MSGSTFIIETERLGLRLWQDTDVIPFAIMNQKDTVMKYFTNKLTSEQSASFIEKIKKHFDDKGYGLWAVELKVTHEFIGFIGFYTPEFKAYFTPCVEIGWRLDDQFWHKG
jgi:ribosomal-protein-alanine N-acetyltransferase